LKVYRDRALSCLSPKTAWVGCGRTSQFRSSRWLPQPSPRSRRG
jgi:hypothetical protein